MPNLPIGYNVEFFDEAGDTVAVATLEEKDLMPLADVLKDGCQEVA